MTNHSISRFDSEPAEEARCATGVRAPLGWRIALYALVGLFIGSCLELLFSALESSTYVPGSPQFLEQFANQHTAVLIERLVYLALGAVVGLSSEVFDFETWSLGRATAVHAVVTTASLVLAAMVLRWVPLGWPLLGFAAVVLGVFALIWLAIYVVTARSVARINAARQGS